jgi:hypothetical protein
VPRPELPLVLVAPHGRTLAGGFGPGADLDGFWSDWNPRYAGDGDTPRYDTPPPRFESFLVDELVPFVEATLPVGDDRDDRALDGVSLGGFGAFKNGLQHPDVFASLGSISGAHNFLFAPGLDPMGGAPAGVAAPVDLPRVSLPGVAGAVVPLEQLPPQLQSFAVAFLVLGDPAVDQTYFRANMPRDLAANARAFTAEGAPLPMRFMTNDTVPRRQEELTNPAGSATAIALEDAVLPMNLEMDLALSNVGVTHSFELHPGLHSNPYRDPYLRDQMAAHLAALDRSARVEVFDYRTIGGDFAVWGWQFSVRREGVHFLNLRDVSCEGLTLQGSGVVTVRVPGRCKTAKGRDRTITVDLGPAPPTDEPAGASAFPAYGRTVRVSLPQR